MLMRKRSTSGFGDPVEEMKADSVKRLLSEDVTFKGFFLHGDHFGAVVRFWVVGDDEVDVLAKVCDGMGNFHKDVEAAGVLESARDVG